MIQPNEAVLIVRQDDGRLNVVAMDIGTGDVEIETSRQPLDPFWIRPVWYDEKRSLNLRLGLYAIAVDPAEKLASDETPTNTMLNTVSAALKTLRDMIPGPHYVPLPLSAIESNVAVLTELRTEYVTQLYAKRLRQLADEMERML